LRRQISHRLSSWNLNQNKAKRDKCPRSQRKDHKRNNQEEVVEGLIVCLSVIYLSLRPNVDVCMFTYPPKKEKGMYFIYDRDATMLCIILD